MAVALLMTFRQAASDFAITFLFLLCLPAISFLLEFYVAFMRVPQLLHPCPGFEYRSGAFSSSGAAPLLTLPPGSDWISTARYLFAFDLADMADYRTRSRV